MDLRRVLATTRRKKKISQAELGKKIGVLNSQISAFERYRAGLNYITFLKYVEAINCRILIIPNEHIEREESDLDPL